MFGTPSGHRSEENKQTAAEGCSFCRQRDARAKIATISVQFFGRWPKRPQDTDKSIKSLQLFAVFEHLFSYTPKNIQNTLCFSIFHKNGVFHAIVRYDVETTKMSPNPCVLHLLFIAEVKTRAIQDNILFS